LPDKWFLPDFTCPISATSLIFFDDVIRFFRATKVRAPFFLVAVGNSAKHKP
jgi:hypothetical protein